jgi:hypothetical protein
VEDILNNIKSNNKKAYRLFRKRFDLKEFMNSNKIETFKRNLFIFKENKKARKVTKRR